MSISSICFPDIQQCSMMISQLFQLCYAPSREIALPAYALRLPFPFRASPITHRPPTELVPLLREHVPSNVLPPLPDLLAGPPTLQQAIALALKHLLLGPFRALLAADPRPVRPHAPHDLAPQHVALPERAVAVHVLELAQGRRAVEGRVEDARARRPDRVQVVGRDELGSVRVRVVVGAIVVWIVGVGREGGGGRRGRVLVGLFEVVEEG